MERSGDYLMANLSRRITLTDLEIVSGLSAWSLQYAFQKRFGCSPVTWIRNERLNAARELLLAGGGHDKVTTAALALSFSIMGEFSRLYWARFGEYPAETLAAARRPVKGAWQATHAARYRPDDTSCALNQPTH